MSHTQQFLSLRASSLLRKSTSFWIFSIATLLRCSDTKYIFSLAKWFDSFNCIDLFNTRKNLFSHWKHSKKCSSIFSMTSDWRLPLWMITSLSIISTRDAITYHLTPSLRSKVEKLLLCICIPLINTVQHQSSKINTLLFKCKYPITDFLRIYAVITSSHLIKRLLHTKTMRTTGRTNKLLLPQNYVSSVLSPNAQNALIKLQELYEISKPKYNIPLIDYILNSAVVKSILPSLRWTLLKYFIRSLHRNRFGHKETKLIDSIIIWLGISVIDPFETIEIDTNILLALYQLILSRRLHL